MPKRRLLSSSIVIPLLGLAPQAPAEPAPLQSLTPVIVTGDRLTDPATTDLSLPAPATGYHSDAADLLRQEAGVSGTRMGGRGIDPIIRGQNQTRLNILLDGAFIHGGCPNRMDPPTVYSALGSYDQISVIRGSHSVIHGPGGSGGTLLFERKPPQFDADANYLGSITGFYADNSDTQSLEADLATGNASGYLRLLGEYQDANNYEDGNGDEVRSAYTSASGNLMLGWTPEPGTLLELNLETQREDDLLYAGAGMDSPYSDADTVRLKYNSESGVGPFTNIHSQIYQSTVDHLMDNYSLREATAPMAMRVPSSSDTTGGRWYGDIALDRQVFTLGMDYQKNDRNANRFSGPQGQYPQLLQAILWPDAELEQMGLFGEWLLETDGPYTWQLGLRYDRVDASISRGDEKPDLGPSPTPNVLYSQYYDRTADSAREDNVSGFVHLQRPLGAGEGHLTLSRSVRTADASERYLAGFARNGMTGVDNSWVGNPQLEPEQHHQLELGYKQEQQRWSLSAAVYYNRVTDYILRDLARGQDSILVNNGTATIYRNIDAELLGTELELALQINDRWRTQASLAYVHAENTSDDRPIAQTPPLELNWLTERQGEQWDYGYQVLANANQWRADLTTGSGQDLRDSPGWGILNLFARYRIEDSATLELGVDNLFDKAYAYHVNRANQDPFNPEPVLVNEPGRQIWGRVRYTF
ncbi:MAG: TonB-dependent copper receptor [Pseudomonadota bacterium]|nr:TonB-dependent copper receptor [Pseudomonadales bacterium]MDY6921377.1 TonB-dependent copper receptor [Pseudomonadota bacterium]